ncbi:MAG: SGNH/GDSL hydrolase family protein [Verrucomicrobiales bacterium]
MRSKSTLSGSKWLSLLNLIINAGIGGHNTENARARLQKNVLSKNPDVVIIQFGINDAAIDVWKNPPAKNSRVSLEQYRENLWHFVEQLKGKNCEIILMTPNPLRWTAKMKKMYGKPPYEPENADGFNLRLKLYAQKMREVAKAEKIELLNIYEAFESFGKKDGQSVDGLLLDGVHPSEKGHQLVADLLKEKINEVRK